MNPQSAISMLQTIALVGSIVTATIALVTVVVKLTRSITAAGVSAESKIERLSGSLDRLAGVVDNGFEDMKEKFEKQDTMLQNHDRRITRVETHNGLDPLP